jgi:hypothetical protein
MKKGTNKKSIKSDLTRVDRMADDDIDYSDIPPLDKAFFTQATTVYPLAKTRRARRLITVTGGRKSSTLK